MIDSFNNRRAQKAAKKAAKREEKLNKNIERAARNKVLLEEADVSEMSTQQKIWIYTKLVFYAAKPFLVYILSPAIAIALGGILIYGGKVSENEEFLSNASNFYAFIGIIFSLIYLFRNSKKRGTTVAEDVSISFKELDFRSLALLFAGGFCASFAISSLYSLLPDFLMKSYDEYTGGIYNGYDNLLVLFSIVLLDPIAEELVFRGYMLNRLLPRLKEKKAVWAVTIVFALCHLSPFWILYGLAMGWLLAKVSIRHDNILYSICFHIGFNIPSMVIFIISQNAHLNDVVFGSKLLIFCYLILFIGMTYFTAERYCKIQDIDFITVKDLLQKKSGGRE